MLPLTCCPRRWIEASQLHRSAWLYISDKKSLTAFHAPSSDVLVMDERMRVIVTETSVDDVLAR